MGLVNEHKPLLLKLLHHSKPAGPVGQDLAQHIVVPGPVGPDPFSAGGFGLLDLLCAFFMCAFLHTHPGQMHREVILGLAASQIMKDVAISRPTENDNAKKKEKKSKDKDCVVSKFCS